MLCSQSYRISFIFYNLSLTDSVMNSVHREAKIVIEKGMLSWFGILRGLTGGTLRDQNKGAMWVGGEAIKGNLGVTS